MCQKKRASYAVSTALMVFCFGWVSPSFGASCGSVFGDGVQTYGSSGTVQFDWRASLFSSPDNQVESVNLIDNNSHSSDKSCGSVSCSASGSPAAAGGSVTFQTGSGTNGSINFSSGSRTIGSAGNGHDYVGNDYTTVTVNNNADLAFSSDYSIYYLDSLIASNQNDITFAPGDYWIDGDLQIINRGKIIVNGGSVRIWVNGNVQFTNRSEINLGGTADQLLIYATGNIDVGSRVDVNGFLYAGGQATTQFQSTVNGALSASSLINVQSQSDVTYDAAAAQNANFGALCNNIPPPVAQWRFDECLYTGGVGEAKDSTSSYDLTPYNNIANASGGIVERYADVTTYTNHFRATTDVPTTSSWTASVWFRKPFLSTGQRYYVIGAVHGGGDLLYLDRNANYRWGVYTTSGTTDGNLRFGTLSNGWHHLVLVGNGGRTYLYMDGSFVESINRQTTGNLRYIGTSYDNVTSSSSAQGFRAPLDEFLFYDIPLSASDISNLYTNQLAGLNFDGSTRAPVSCTGSLDHLEIQVGSNSASTCAAKAITIRACADAAVPCTTLKDDYTGTVSITTSSSHGNWSVNTAVNTLSPNPDADDNGAVSYTFADTDDGDVILDLSNTHADDLTITVTDTAASETVTSSTLQFRDNAFVITPDTVTVAGRDQTMTVTAYRRDGANCGVMTAYDGVNLPLKAWLTRDVAIDPAGVAPTIGGTPLPDSQPGGNNIQLSFSSGVASLVMSTTDVGRYVLELLDDSRVYVSGVDIGGSTSSNIVTRPFGFDIDFSNDRQNNGTGGSSYAASLAGSAFAVAETDFSTTVTAVRWQSGDDANDDGVPDAGADLSNNVATPSFGAEGGGYTGSVTLLPSIVAPAGGIDGSLSSNTFSAFSGGLQTQDMQWNNVGIIDISGQLNNYMNGGQSVSGVALNVGRFYPSHFLLVNPVVSNACGSFTYMGQPELSISFDVEARGASSVIALSNYDESDGYNLAGDPTYLAENDDDGTDLSTRVSNIPDASWTAGVYSVSTSTATFNRQLSGMPEAPMTGVDLGVFYADTDASLSALNMNAGSTGDCIFGGMCTGKEMGTIEARYGRMRLQDAFGPEIADLPVNFSTEYYDGTDWQLNVADSCTQFDVINIDLNGASAPAAGTFTGVVIGGGITNGTFNGAPAGPVQFLSGSSGWSFSATGQGNTGAITMDVSNVDDWLRFDWNQDGSYDDAGLPQATFTFGSYRGHDRIINWIEVLQ